MRVIAFILFFLSCTNVFSQTDDLPFRIYLVEPKARCIALVELTKVVKLKITDTTMIITGFLCGYLSAKDTIWLKNKGAEFQSKFLEAFKGAKNGDQIYISGVKVLVLGGKYPRTLAEQIILQVGCRKEEY